MTATQATHARRISRRAMARREQRLEESKAIAAIVLLFLAFLFAGTLDYEDERRELERWERQGITVIRDW